MAGGEQETRHNEERWMRNFLACFFELPILSDLTSERAAEKGVGVVGAGLTASRFGFAFRFGRVRTQEQRAWREGVDAEGL